MQGCTYACMQEGVHNILNEGTRRRRRRLEQRGDCRQTNTDGKLSQFYLRSIRNECHHSGLTFERIQTNFTRNDPDTMWYGRRMH